MTARKAAVEAKPASEAAKQPRELAKVVEQMREMREAGKTVPEICEALEVSYPVVNQVMKQSYKMSMNTIEVFERQEKMRLGLTAEE